MASHPRFKVKSTQAGVRELLVRIDGSAVTASASATGLDEGGASDVTVARGGAGATNEITLTFDEAFRRVPDVVACPLSPVSVWIKSVAVGSVVLEVAHIYRVGGDAAATGTTASIITATGHAAAAKDWIVMTSGDELGEMREVSAADANTITLASALSGTPSAAETFDILRPVVVSDADIHVLIVGSDSESEF